MKPKKHPQKRCIIADDVRSSRELLGVWLREMNYECVLVGDGTAAIEEAVVNVPTLIITDIEMPKCNGLELLSAIRCHESEELQRIPVIIISSLQDQKMVELVRGFGATSVMCKPLGRLQVHSVLAAIESGEKWVDSCDDEIAADAITPAVSPKLRRMADQLFRERGT